MNYRELRGVDRGRTVCAVPLVMTDGRAFEIGSPSMLWPGRDTVLVGLPDNSAELDIPAQHVTVSMLRIIRVEPLEPTATVPSA